MAFFSDGHHDLIDIYILYFVVEPIDEWAQINTFHNDNYSLYLQLVWSNFLTVRTFF